MRRRTDDLRIRGMIPDITLGPLVNLRMRPTRIRGMIQPILPAEPMR